MTVVSVDRAELVGALRHLKKVAARPGGDKPTKLVTFTAQKRRLVATACDGAEQVTWKIAAETTKGGASTVSLVPEPMLALLSAISNESVTLTFSENGVSIHARPVTAFVPTVATKAMTIPRPSGTIVPITAGLRAAILRAVSHAPTVSYKPVLEAVMFDRGAVVATDGFTMVVSEGFRMFPNFAVPAAALGRALAGAGADAQLVVGPRSIGIVDARRSTIIARPGDEGVDLADRYPKWRPLLAKKPGESVVEFGRAEMLDALRAPSIVNPDTVTLTQDTYDRARQAIHVRGINERATSASIVQATIGKLPGPLLFNVELLKRALDAQSSPTVRMVATRTPKRAGDTAGAPILHGARLIDGHCTVLIVPMQPA